MEGSWYQKYEKAIPKFNRVNPNDESKNVYFAADAPHLYKNIRSALVNNKIIELPVDITEKYHLPTNIVNVSHIKNLADFQEDLDLQLAPKLTPELLNLNHFNTMKVSNAYHLLHRNVSAARNFLVDEVDETDKNALTTA